jgi:hypothetical protein
VEHQVRDRQRNRAFFSGMVRGVSDACEGSEILSFLFRPRLVCRSLLHSPKLVERLSEKGSEGGFESGFGRYEEAEMGPKEPSRWSVGPRQGCFQGFSDGLGR